MRRDLTNPYWKNDLLLRRALFYSGSVESKRPKVSERPIL
jgi:hypothetical protein